MHTANILQCAAKMIAATHYGNEEGYRSKTELRKDDGVTTTHPKHL